MRNCKHNHNVAATETEFCMTLTLVDGNKVSTVEVGIYCVGCLIFLIQIAFCSVSTDIYFGYKLRFTHAIVKWYKLCK